MTEKAFRLDFFIAIAALLISALTAGALVYQTRVIADQYAATIWPYLSGDSTAGPTGLSMRIINDGLGPALLKSAQLVVDGKTVSGWDDYLHIITQDPPTRTFFEQLQNEAQEGKPITGSVSTASLGPGTTIRPGDVFTLLNIDLPGAPVVTMNHHTIRLRLCYCSLNNNCWTLDTTKPALNQTKQVRSCTTTFSIQPAFLRSPSVLQHKK